MEKSLGETSEVLKNSSIGSLKVVYRNLSQEYRVLRFNKVLGVGVDLNSLKFLRKKIARVCSELRVLKLKV